FRVFPVDQPDGLRVLAHIGLHLHAVAEQVVDRPVAVVEALAGVARRFREQVQRPRDQGFVYAPLLEPGGQQVLFDAGVACTVFPITQVGVAQRIAEQLHDTGLGLLFDLADGAHTRRVLPVSSSRIMPCLRSRVLASRCSNAASSASMSDSTSAMAVCSFGGGISSSIDLMMSPLRLGCPPCV